MSDSESEDERTQFDKFVDMGLSHAQVREFLDVFEMFDTDNSGNISSHELTSVLRVLGKQPKPLHIQQTLKKYDKNNSGALGLEEFMQYMAQSAELPDSRGELKRALEVFDTEGDGLMSVEAFREAMAVYGDSMPPYALDQLMEDACRFMRNGEIDIEAFADAMVDNK